MQQDDTQDRQQPVAWPEVKELVDIATATIGQPFTDTERKYNLRWCRGAENAPSFLGWIIKQWVVDSDIKITTPMVQRSMEMIPWAMDNGLIIFNLGSHPHYTLQAGDLFVAKPTPNQDAGCGIITTSTEPHTAITVMDGHVTQVEVPHLHAVIRFHVKH